MVLVAVPILLAALVLAAAWALIMMGNQALVRPFAEWLADKLGPLGGAIMGAVDAFNDWITGAYDFAFNQAVTPLGHAIAAIPTHATQLVDQAIALFTAIVYVLTTVGGSAVDTAIGAVTGMIEAAVAPVRDFANWVNDVRIPNTEWFISAVQLELWNAHNWLSGRVDALEAGLTGTVDRALDAALAGVYGAIENARAEAWSAVAGIEAGIDARLAGWGASIEARTTGLIDGLTRELAALRAALVDAIPGLDTRIAEAAAAAATAAAVAATVTTTTAEWIRTCGEPLCQSFGPDIPHIHAFNDMITAGLLAAWVSDAIANPDAAAARTDALVVGPISAAVNIFESMGARN